jgi:PAS domain S-box-containing protein
MRRTHKSQTTMRIDILPEGRVQEEASSGGTAQAAERAAGPVPVSYNELLQCIYDGVLITDMEGTIVESNARAAELMRGDAASLAGQFIMQLVSGADTAVWSAIQQNLAENRYTLLEARVLRADRSTFPAEIAVNRLSIREGGLLCFFIRDITIRKQAQEALEDAVARLEAHDQSRMQFISNVSHELRTPLTSMIYAISNVLRGVVGPVSDAVRKYLEMLDGDCKRLLATVNDILDLRKIESQDLTLLKARVPFSRLVARSVESLGVRAQQKSITLRVQRAQPELFVDCDPQKMERVVLNIAGNAVKFTPDDGRVELRVSQDPMHQNFVRLEVTDTGIGIPPEALGRVMERYFTVGEQPSGSGLGLAIAKEIVALHGGSIDLRSPPPGQDHGTMVTVCLPRVESPTVLVVDDVPAVRDLMRDQLTHAGYRVITGADGSEALTIIRERMPSVVILDLGLPEVPGTDLLFQLKSDRATRRVPLIAVTGLAVGKDKEQVLKSFSVPLLTKPWSEDELLDRVEEAFLGRAARLK